MTEPKPDTFRETDDEARDLARRLIAEARHGALGLLMDGQPFVTRVALAPAAGHLTTLISDLAPHTHALRDQERGSLMIGEPGKGDPLAHPRMTLQVNAIFLEKTPAETDAYLEEWRRADPVECGDELAQEADNACAAIETDYDKDRLKSLINNEGWAQPR